MENVVSLNTYVTFNSNVNNRGKFAKCAIGYSNYNNDIFERGSLIFLTNNNANTNNINMENDTRMCINSDGNIGMGTTININERLIVNGNVKIDNGFLLTCNLIVGSLNAINILGVGSNITNINTSNITDGILPVSRGGIGINTLGVNQLLTTNSTGDRIINSGTGLRWNINTNTLFASNIVGIGSNITNIHTSNITDGILPVIRGGTGLNTLGINQLLTGNNTGDRLINSGIGLTWNNNTNTLFASNITGIGSNITNINTLNITDGILPVVRGGTGINIFGSNQLLVGTGTSAIITSSNLSWNNNILNATNINSSNIISSNILIINTLSTTNINATNNINTTNLTATTINVTNINTLGTISGNGATITNINANGITDGILPIVRGGTGINTLGTSQLLIGNGINQITSSSNLFWNNATNTLVTSNIDALNIRGIGSNITRINISNITDGILPVVRGGIGTNSLGTNELLVGNATGTLISSSNLMWNNTTNTLTTTNLTATNLTTTNLTTNVSDTRLLVGGGTNPVSGFSGLTWISNTNTLNATNISGNGSLITTINADNISSGTLLVNRGGTGTTTLGANQLLVGNASGTLISSPNLTWNNTTNTLSTTNLTTNTLNATNISGNGSAITNINANNILTGTLLVNRGGTGTTTLGVNQLLVGNATGALISSTNLTWNNTTNILSTTNLTTNNITTINLTTTNLTTSVSDTRLLVGGGTNPVSGFSGLTWTSLSNTLNATNISGNGSAITNINADNILTGTLLVNRGGTGLTTLGANQLLVGNATGALISSTNLTWNNTTNILSTTNLTTNNMTTINLTTTNLTTSVSDTRLLVGGGTNPVSGFSGLTWTSLSNTLNATNISGNGSAITNINANNILTGTLNSDRLPIANTNILGCVRVDGTTININGTGVISLSTSSSLWTANGNNIYNNLVGNVGIGTTNPTSRLHIPTIDPSTNAALLDFRNGGNYGIYATTTTISSRGNTIDFLSRDFNNSAGIQTRNILSLRPEGNVGIGITNPSELLHVNGNFRATGYITSGSGADIVSGNHIYTTASTGRLGIGINPNTPTSSIVHLHRTTTNTEIKLQLTDGTTLSTGTDGLTLYKGTDQHGYLWNYENNALIFGTNNSERMRILADGNIGIGTTNPTAYKLNVDGIIAASQDIIAYYSDERLKTISNYINNVLPDLDKINVFKYKCNDIASSYGYDKNKEEIGLSAQEIQKYYPELVTLAPFDTILDEETKKIKSKSGKDYLTLKYERLVPVLLQAIKELNCKYNILEDKYNKLEKILNNRN